MSAAALDRQIRVVFDALDSGSNKTVIVSCNKLLKKYPTNTLLKALKSLALVRTQKIEDAIVLCDEVLAAHPTDEAVLNLMMHSLKTLGRNKDMVTMYEEAYKRQPTNEELGAQTFFAHVRTGNWKNAQQVATKMNKQFQEDRYLYWSIICATLQAKDPATPEPMKELLFKLAHRLVTSSPTPSYISSERFYLHLTILKELKLWDEANTLLVSNVGQKLCAASLLCDELRREIWSLRGLSKEEGEKAQVRITENNDRNWLEFLSVLDGTFSYVSDEKTDADEKAKEECTEHASKTREFLAQIAEKDGSRDRSASLALLELESRSKKYDLSANNSSLVDMMRNYFDKFGSRPSSFEDLKSYVMLLSGDDRASWTSYLESITLSTASVLDVQRTINVHKLIRLALPESELTVEKETERAETYRAAYFAALPLGAELNVTDYQPADDLALLAAHAYINLWEDTEDEAWLHRTVVFLQFTLSKSKQAYNLRLVLIAVYRLLGAPSLALEQYRMLDIKQIQNDTLSHLILSRSPMFSLAPLGDITWLTECQESSQVYASNTTDTPEWIIRAFIQERYSQIPEFIAFEDRLDNSLQRDQVKMDHVRMRLAHEPINADFVDMELIEFKFVFDRSHHDNRDLKVMPNYQPHCINSLFEQTILLDQLPGNGWLWLFLKIYIRAFAHASDLDDTVEEKLLIGDRPKQSLDPDRRRPLKERLVERPEKEIEELTRDEREFLKYADGLADWLEPYHDYTRPPPSVVLAEAAKANPRAVDPATLASLTANGNPKKDEEAPPVKETPEVVAAFFEKMGEQFKEALKESIPTGLHVAHLTQEAFLLLVVESMRFKQPAVVKANKLGQLVQSLKNVRAGAITVLESISSQLVDLGKEADTVESRKAFVETCQPIIKDAIEHDYVVGEAKKFTEARKKILDGIGRGISKICTTYTT